MNIVILALASLGNGGSNFLGDASILRMARRDREEECVVRIWPYIARILQGEALEMVVGGHKSPPGGDSLLRIWL